MKELFKNLKFVWKYAKKEKIRIIIYIISNVIAVVGSIIIPVLGAKQLIGLTNNIMKQFLGITIIIVLCQTLFETLNTIRSRLYLKIFRNIYIDLQTDLGAEILKLNNRVLEENGSGLFIQRLTNDTKNISSIFTTISQYINSMLSHVGVLATIFVINKYIFLFTVFALIVRFIIERLRIKTYYENDKEYKKHYDELTGFTGEIVRGAEDIKMLNGEKSFIEELKTRFKSINEESLKMEKTNLNYFFIRYIWYQITYLGRHVLMVIFIMNGSLEIANAVVLHSFGDRVTRFVNDISGFIELVSKFNLSASRIFEIYENKKFTKETFGDKHLDKVEGNFEFKNVSFKYDKNKVLNDLSFKVKANETVAFVGKSGAGKTTLFNLLCKMYDNYKGTITIDGVDIKELDKESIRGNITIVSQNPYIFNMSIKDNLRLVKKDLTTKEMKEACKMACLDEFIESLPDKYNTVVGEGGVTLSGGQKQRLAIARAFVQKTEIILFDEATSALDNETQAEIQKAIDNLQKDYTILIIAHRLSTIKNADRILFIDDGKVIAEGSHEKLLKKCKQYKELYENEITKIDEK